MNSLLVIGGSLYTIPLIKAGQKLGFQVHACSSIPSDPGLFTADVGHQVSILDIDALVKVCENINPRGIVCAASDLGSLVVGTLNESLSLKGIMAKQVKEVTNKRRFVELQTRLGLPTPKTRILSGNKPIIPVDVTYPAILKPVFASGSRGVFVVHSAVEAALKAPLSIGESSLEKSCLLQTFLTDYKEIGCECYIEDGRISFLETTHKVLNERNVPLGHYVPNKIGQDVKADLVKQIESIAQELGVRFSALNLDVMIKESNRPIIIDMSLRLGGNMLPDLMHLAFGLNPYVRVISHATNIPIEPFSVESNDSSSASIVFGTPKEIVFTEALRSAIEKTLRGHQVIELHFDLEVGAFCREYTQGNRRFGHVVLGNIELQDYLGLQESLTELFRGWDE